MSQLIEKKNEKKIKKIKKSVDIPNQFDIIDPVSE
jgi:hypothetical protein